MQATFNHVNAKLQSGNYTQTIGRWERDYDVILRKLDAQEQRKKQEYSKNLENQKRSLAAIRESWKDIARSFSLNEKSGLTIKPLPSTKDMARFTVILRNISAVFSVQQINDLDNERIEQWHVTLEPRPNAGRLEVEISNAIQSRGRKWDLAYLLVRQRC